MTVASEKERKIIEDTAFEDSEQSLSVFLSQ